MPTKYVVAGVDGTGSREWRRTDGRNSHVFRFIADVAAGGSGDISVGVSSADGAKRYWHGPGTFATDLNGIIDEVFEFVVSQTDRLVRETGCTQSDVKICLVGHSRGCVAAIKVANMLNDPGSVSLRDAVRVSLSRLRAPVAVTFIGLYDTVNRSTVDIDVAMPNVAAGVHTRRQNRSWSGSRFSFDTVEIPRFPPVDLDTAHGGMGGDPGYFTPLGETLSDYYCNAVQLVLTQAELNAQYGIAASRGGSAPRYRVLAGDEAAAQRRRLRRSVQAVAESDRRVRQGATGAGFQFGATSSLMPYSTGQEGLYTRLLSLVGTES